MNTSRDAGSPSERLVAQFLQRPVQGRDYARALSNRGRALLDQGLHAEALIVFERALGFDGTYPPARQGRADTLLAMGQHRAARRDLERLQTAQGDEEAARKEGAGTQPRPAEGVTTSSRDELRWQLPGWDRMRILRVILPVAALAGAALVLRAGMLGGDNAPRPLGSQSAWESPGQLAQMAAHPAEEQAAPDHGALLLFASGRDPDPVQHFGLLPPASAPVTASARGPATAAIAAPPMPQAAASAPPMPQAAASAPPMPQAAASAPPAASATGAAPVPAARPQGAGLSRASGMAVHALDLQTRLRLGRHISGTYAAPASLAGAIVDEVSQVGRQLQIDPLLLLAIIAVESRFDPQAQSPRGAQGLMQVLTPVHAERFASLGGVTAAFDLAANIRIGAQILSEYLSRHGSTDLALKHYVGAARMAHDSGYAVKVSRVRSEFEMIAAGGLPAAPAS